MKRYLKDLPLTVDPETGSSVVVVEPNGYEFRLPLAQLASGIELADVAISGNYNDLNNTPVIPPINNANVNAAIGQNPALSRNAMSLGNSAVRNIGTTAGTVPDAADPRFSDDRYPTPHSISHYLGGPDHLAPGLIGAAAEVHTHQAVQVLYDPTVPTDWGTGDDPEDVHESLDKLANRIKALEGGGSGPGGGGVTGDLKYAMRAWSDPPEGWIVAMGTIGSAISGATTRAHADCKQLFMHLWSAISVLYAPVSGGKGLNALDDWEADKTITIPDMRGRILLTLDSMGGGSPAGVVTEAGSGVDGGWQGKPGGYQNHTLTVDEMPTHRHMVSTFASIRLNGGTGYDYTVGNYGEPFGGWTSSGDATTSYAGGDQPHSNMPPVVPFPLFIKL